MGEHHHFATSCGRSMPDSKLFAVHGPLQALLNAIAGRLAGTAVEAAGSRQAAALIERQ